MAARDIVFWEVDTQYDFILPKGKLYVPGAEKRIPNMKRLVDAARAGKVFLVSDACQHTLDDPEFNRFPPHCIRGTEGAQILPELLAENHLVIPNDARFRLPANLLDYQQVILEKQTLDVFDNPHAATIVHRLEPKAEFVVFGVATEYCVRCAAKGLLERRRRVTLVADAIETLKPEDGKKTLSELSAKGARLITTGQALALLEKEGKPGPAEASR